VVLCAALGALAAPAAAQLPDGRACYNVALGPWTPGSHGMHSGPRLPERVLVDTVDPGYMEPPARALRPAPGLPPSGFPIAHALPQADGVRFVWSTGFSGAHGILLNNGRVLHGTLTAFDDEVIEGEVEPTAPLRLTPVACDARVPVAWRPVWRDPRGVALAEGDSLRLGEPPPARFTSVVARGGLRSLEAQPVGLFAHATSVAARADSITGRLVEIRLRLPATADVDSLVAGIARVAGEPDADDADPGLFQRHVSWRDRMRSVTLMVGESGTNVMMVARTH
jgi:hypothetical protein